MQKQPVKAKDYSLGLYEKAMPDSLSFREKLTAAKNSGFDRLELSIDETDARISRLDWSRAERREIRDAFFELEVPVKTLCLSAHRRFPLGSRDSKTRERAAEIFEKAIRLAADIGVSLIQLAGYDVYYEEGGEDTRAWFLENLASCVKTASEYGVLLGFETMETPFMDTVEKAMAVVNQINSPYLGVYPDIGNLKNASVLYGSSLPEDIEKGRGHFFAAHLKESKPGIYRDLSFGSGHTEYVPCIRQLYSVGVRMFTGEFWHQGEDDFMAALTAASVFLREQIETAIHEINIDNYPASADHI